MNSSNHPTPLSWIFVITTAAVSGFGTLAVPATWADAQEVHTERFDLPDVDLGSIGNEFTLDYYFPPLPAEIVATRFNLTLEIDAATDFDAAEIGIVLQPPIDDPNSPDDRVLTEIRTGADFGWSGHGTFSFSGETDALNGRILDAPPDAIAMLYGVTLFNAERLTNPNDSSPLGGRFVSSYIEVDYVVVPEPAVAPVICFLTCVIVCWQQRRAV